MLNTDSEAPRAGNEPETDVDSVRVQVLARLQGLRALSLEMRPYKSEGTLLNQERLLHALLDLCVQYVRDPKHRLDWTSAGATGDTVVVIDSNSLLHRLQEEDSIPKKKKTESWADYSRTRMASIRPLLRRMDRRVRTLNRAVTIAATHGRIRVGIAAEAVGGSPHGRLGTRQPQTDPDQSVGMSRQKPRAQDIPAYARVENFRQRYLGTSEAPVGFGGRQRDLDYLNQWLQSRAGRPYLLLIGPAGRGKSALLVQWTEQIAQRDEVDVIFFPISIRFSTNREVQFLQFMVECLARRHGECTPTQDAPEHVLRSLLAQYLRRPLPDGRRLVLVIDALDEAAAWRMGPDLFPAERLPHLQVVVSARAMGTAGEDDWLSQLGWSQTRCAVVHALGVLGADGIRDVLRETALGTAAGGLPTSLVAEILRLSEGEPFLVEWYAQSLRERHQAKGRLRIRPPDLRDMTPGLRGFLERWWQDQRTLMGDRLNERHVQLVLDALSCSLGPMSLDDLQQVIAAKCAMSGREIRNALEPIGRLIIKANADGHYVLAQSQLREFFRSQLTDSDRAEWEQAFVAYGNRIIADLTEGRIPPERVPTYLIQHFGSHLQRTNRTYEEMASLTTEGWMKAWRVVDRGYAGFLADVQRARMAASQANQKALDRGIAALPAIGIEMRCALIESSISSLAVGIPERLLVALVRTGEWTSAQAIASARRLTDPFARAETMAALLPVLSATDVGMAGELAREALGVARTVSAPFARAMAIAKVAANMKTSREARHAVTDAVQLAGSFAAAHLRALALTAVAEVLREDSGIEEIIRAALSSIRRTKLDGLRTSLFLAVAQLFPASARYNRMALHILNAAYQFGRERRDPGICLDVAKGMAKRNHFREASEMVRCLGDSLERDEALAAIAVEKAKSNGLRVSLKLAIGIQSPGARSSALLHLSRRMDGTEKERTLLHAFRAAWSDEREREAGSTAYLDLATELARIAWVDKALKLARTCRWARDRAAFLGAIAECVPDAILRHRILVEALGAVRRIEDDAPRAKVISWLIEGITDTADKEEAALNAESAFRKIESVNARTLALAGLGGSLSEEGHAELRKEIGRDILNATASPPNHTRVPAREIMKGIFAGGATAIPLKLLNSDEGGRALGELLGDLTKCTRLGLAIDNGSVAHAADEKSEAAAAIACGLAREKRTKEALAAASAIRSGPVQVLSLLTIASQMPDDKERRAVLSQAVQVAHHLSEARTQADALAAAVQLQSGRRKHDILKQATDSFARLGDNEPYETMALALTKADRVSSALQIAGRVSSDCRWRVLRDMAIMTASRNLPAIQRAAERLPSTFDRDRVLAQVVEKLVYAAGLRVASRAAAAIETPVWRSSAVLSIASGTKEANRRWRRLAEGLSAVVGSEDPTTQRIFCENIRKVSALPIRDAYSVFEQLIPKMSKTARCDLHVGLEYSVSVLHMLGGDQALIETAKALEDVGEWWP